MHKCDIFIQMVKAGATEKVQDNEKVEYSWWSYRFNARANNAGWRIDYFIISNDLKDKLIT